MMPHPFAVRVCASPTAPVPPAVAADHPPVYYALIHSPKYIPQNTPPCLSKKPTPGVYIFSEKVLRTFVFAFKLKE